MGGKCGRIVKGRPCKAGAVGRSGYCIFHGPSREAKIRKAKKTAKRIVRSATKFDVGAIAYRRYRRRR